MNLMTEIGCNLKHAKQGTLTAYYEILIFTSYQCARSLFVLIIYHIAHILVLNPI